MCTEPVLHSSADFLAIARIFWFTQLNGFAAVGLCSFPMVGTGRAVQHLPACPLVFPGVLSLECGYKPGCCSPITRQLRQSCHQLLVRISRNGGSASMGSCPIACWGWRDSSGIQTAQHLAQLLWQGIDLQARVTSLFWPFKIHFLGLTCNLRFAHRGARVCEVQSWWRWHVRQLLTLLKEVGCNDRSQRPLHFEAAS